MIKGEYDNQSLVLATKLKEATLFELDRAWKEGRLQCINPEYIGSIAEIVYLYYSEANRPFAGSITHANINSIIQIALKMYAEVKLGYRAKGSSNDPALNELIRQSSMAFAEKVGKIDIHFNNPELEKFIESVNQHPFGEYTGSFEEEERIVSFAKPAEKFDFVQNPICKFENVGNSSAFCLALKNMEGIPVRQQFFDEKGTVLPNPITTYYYNGDWQTNPPTRSWHFVK